MSYVVVPFRRLPNAARRSAVAAVALAGLALSCTADSLDPNRPAVASVVVSPDRLAVGVGGSASLVVEVRDAGGTLLHDRKVAWATKDASIATVSEAGVVAGVAPGSVQVAATAEGKSAIVEVTVNPKPVASLRLTPSSDQQLFVGQTKQMTAETLDAAGSVLAGRPVAWSSSSPSVASVSGTGLITAVAPGGAVITATSEGKTAVVAVTVAAVPIATIVVTPTTGDVVVAQTLQLTATPKDAQGGVLTGRALAWSSSDASRATVTSTGVVTGVAPGAVTITASAEGKSGTASITVKEKPVAAVIVSPAQFSVAIGQTQALAVQVTDDQGNVLTGRPVTFATNDATIATVSATGVVTGMAVGSAKITATSEGKTATSNVTVTPVPVARVDVTPPQSTLAIGQSVALTATPRDANGNPLPGRPVAWTTGAPSVVTVSPAGVVTAVGPGTGVLIIATVEGRAGSATINVRQVSTVSVTPSPINVGVLCSAQLAATPRDAAGNAITGLTPTWASNAPAIASVTAQGLVQGVANGSAAVTAAYGSVTGTASVTARPIATVTVTPNPATVKVNQTVQLSATVRDATGSALAGCSVTWSSGNTTRATVDPTTGLVTGRVANATPVPISASSGSVSGQSQVTVNP